jgi:hypothetical protein
MVLQVFRQHKLYAKISKCIFYQKKIHYLGHIISADEITIDPEKIDDIIGWTTPRNVIEVRYFMSHVGYYRRFINGVSNISNPMTSLQKKGVKFEWNPKCEETFQQSKDVLTSAPILKIAE